MTTLKEKTWIDEIIEISRNIIMIKQTMLHLKEALYFSTRTSENNIIDRETLKEMYFKYEQKLRKLEIKSANLLKAACGNQYVIKGKNFHLSSNDLTQGYAFVSKIVKVEDKTTGTVKPILKTAILFLANNEDTFLEPINAGEIRLYDDVKDRLKPISVLKLPYSTHAVLNRIHSAEN